MPIYFEDGAGDQSYLFPDMKSPQKSLKTYKKGSYNFSKNISTNKQTLSTESSNSFSNTFFRNRNRKNFNKSQQPQPAHPEIPLSGEDTSNVKSD